MKIYNTNYINKLVCFIVIALLVFSCTTPKQAVVNLIVYTDFVNPKSTYDSLVKDINQLELVDSIKIIGRPLSVSAIEIQIDTLRANKYGVSIEEIKNKTGIVNENRSQLSELMNSYILAKTGESIPVSAVATYYFVMKNYKPQIFIPRTEGYKHKDRRAVKVELYCKRNKEYEAIKFLTDSISNYSDVFGWEYQRIEYDIVKTYVPIDIVE